MPRWQRAASLKPDTAFPLQPILTRAFRATRLILEIDRRKRLPVVVTDSKAGVRFCNGSFSGQYNGPSWSTLGATYKGQVWRLK